MLCEHFEWAFKEEDYIDGSFLLYSLVVGEVSCFSLEFLLEVNL